MKGRNLPYVFVELEKRYKEWEAKTDELVGRPEIFHNLAMYNVLRLAVRRLISLCKLKHGYLDVMPWLLARARDPSVAARCIALYQEEEKWWADGGASKPPHRVTRKFCDQSLGDLPAMMASHAAGNGLPEALSVALSAYEQVLMDESAGEGYHRNVSMQAKRAPSAKMCYHAGTKRLEQNLALYKRYVAAKGNRCFEKLWRGWKSVLQTNTSRSQRIVGLRLSRKQCMYLAYRARTDISTDWNWLQDLTRRLMALFSCSWHFHSI